MQFARNLILHWLKVPASPEQGFGRQGNIMVFRASPKYFQYKQLFWAFGTLTSLLFVVPIGGGALLGVLVAADVEPAIKLLVGMAGLLAALIYLFLLFFSYQMMRLDYEMRWYILSDKSIRIREGIWFLREMTMTNANVQNIEINQNPLERFFGISNVMVQSAGGGSGAPQEAHKGANVLFDMHKGFFRGVENAEEIRRILRDRLNKQKDSGLGDHDDQHVLAPSTAPLSEDLVECLNDVWREAHEYRKTLERFAAAQ